MRHSSAFLTILAAAAASAASCGDNSKRCGEGTEANAQGYCVPVQTTTCGEGTVQVGDECVPDGTVICEQGTVYDQTVGGCVPSDEVCADGTVFVDGQCVPEDETLTADRTEAAEPNDGATGADGIAGQFAAPAVGQSTSIHGCITPYRDLDGNGNPDPDEDLWVITTTGPALLEITADGVGGLTAGFLMFSGTGDPVIDGAWFRYGLNLTGDTSRRQVYLPVAGAYGLLMTDTRAIFSGEGVGDAGTCYYTTITNLPVPSPTAIEPNTEIAGSYTGAPAFFALDAEDGSMFIGVHELASATGRGSLLALKNGAPFELDATVPVAEAWVGGLAATDEVVYVVEPVYHYGLTAAPYTLEVTAPPVAPLPADGGSVTIDNGDGWDLLAWLDAGDDEMVHLDLAVDVAATIVILDDHGYAVAPARSGTSLVEWVRLPGAGRYHVLVLTSAATPETFELSSTVTSAMITDVAIGTALADQELVVDAGWYRVTPGSARWLSFEAAATDFGGNVKVDLFDDRALGFPGGTGFAVIQAINLPASGTGIAGRVTHGENIPFLARVTSAGTPLEGATFDLDVQLRDHTDLGLLDENTSAQLEGIELAAGDRRLYFLRAAPGYTVTITATPDALDLVIQTLNRNEATLATRDAGGDGAAETMTFVMGPQGWTAFRVYEYWGDAETFDLTVTAVPPPYLVSTGSTAYADACATGVDITPANTDDGAVDGTLGFTFPLFGTAAPATYRLSTNGFLAFSAWTGDQYINAALPSTSQPNGMIAPYWDDLNFVTVCRLEETDKVTFQWSGVLWGTSTQVRTQAILHATGVVEFVYGAGHQANGSSATVGIENLAGTQAIQLSFNQANSVMPGTSRVFTPTN